MTKHSFAEQSGNNAKRKRVGNIHWWQLALAAMAMAISGLPFGLAHGQAGANPPEGYSVSLTVGGTVYQGFGTGLTNGAWVYVDADPAASSVIRPTQRSLGYREVTYKSLLFQSLVFWPVTPTTNGSVIMYDYSFQSDKTNLVGYWKNKDVPVIIGPDGLAYITDGHQTTAGYMTPDDPVRAIVPGQNRVILGHIVANLFDPLQGPKPVDDAWWLARQSENNAFLFGPNGNQLALPQDLNYASVQPILPSVLPLADTPSSLGPKAMTLDHYRSLTWSLADGIVKSAVDNTGKKIAGYKKGPAWTNNLPDINFVEFYWADFLRNRIVWDDTQTGSPLSSTNSDRNAVSAPLSFFTAVANGIALARSEAYRDQYGRGLSDYTNAALFAPNTVNWAQISLSNGLAAAKETYHLYLQDDSSIAGDIIPSAVSVNILHIDTGAGLSLTQAVKNINDLYVNAGGTLATAWKDAVVTNSTLALPAGTGAVWLEGSATVSGSSFVNDGALVVSGVLNSSLLRISKGLLTGKGTINGSVAIMGDGALAPGPDLATLTINGDLTLSGTTAMELKKSGALLTSDRVAGLGNLIYGGELVVTASGDTLAAGDTFKLFGAASYSRSFGACTLPKLAAGLSWDTSKLLVDGSIAVGTAGAAPPLIVFQTPPQKANIGMTVVLAGGAVGSEPISYQWYFGDTPILQPATTALLEIANVQAANQGQYWYVAHNAAGSATSAPVALVVAPHYGVESFDGVVNNGVGVMPAMKYNYGEHSNQLIPMYAQGPGAELFHSYATNTDLARGPYIDNTDIYRVMKAAMAGGAKNVVLMISDGAGYNTWDAASYYQYGELGRQVYDHFPVQYPCSTFPLSTSLMPTVGQATNTALGWYDQTAWQSFYKNTSNWTDSAAAGTALSCGAKTYNNAICWSDDNQYLTNISETAKLEFGKKVGVLTTVEFAHATPAVFSAHNTNRNNYALIASEQLTNSVVDVLMGAGHPTYTDDGAPTTSVDYRYVGGSNLWSSLSAGKLGWNVVQSKADFEALALGTFSPTGRVCGIVPERTTTQQARGGDGLAPAYGVPFNTNNPSLAVMTKGAINALVKDNQNGFFMMVEGGAIDWANHAWQAGRCIEEQVDFNRAVEAVVDWVNAHSSWDDTLVIVTADHETGMLYGPTAGGIPTLAAAGLGPTGIQGLITEHSSLPLTWAPVLGATGYTVNVTAPDSTVTTYTVTTNRLTMANVSFGTYNWTVTGFNSFGVGPVSDSASTIVAVQGLVGVGRIPADSFDARGPGLDTLGGIGSGAYFDPGTWARTGAAADYTYSGTLYAVPDRGFGDGAQNYLPRLQTIALSIAPYYGLGPVAQTQVILTNTATTLFTYDGTNFTGFDADVQGSPCPMSSANSLGQGHRSLDAEGIVRARDGGFYVSDEYGPFIYRFSSTGALEYTLQPPAALLPKLGNYPGTSYFTATNTPTSGRRNNRGLEGLSMTPDGKRLMAMLQSPTVQDGGAGNFGQITRVLVFDIDPASPTYNQPIAEYPYQLTLNGTAQNNRHTPASEILALNRQECLVLERDSQGYGAGTNLVPTYKRIVYASLAKASNLINTGYDLEKGAPGQLSFASNAVPAGMTAVSRLDLINMLDTNQLTKFGLNLSTNQDMNTISEKWESLALIPLNDPVRTNDFLLLTMNDNDFKAPVVYHNGVAVGTNAQALDTVALVYRVTLPTYDAPVPTNQFPSVVLSVPTNATFSAPADFSLAAVPYDQDGLVTKVEFYDGAVQVGQATAFPFTIKLAGVPAGTHSYTAVAYDNEGATATSKARTVTVTETNILPWITLAGPTNATLSAPAMVALTAAGGDLDGQLAKLSIYDGETKLGESATTPFTLVLSNVLAGVHTYYGVATDNHGETNVSAPLPVTVTVENLGAIVQLTTPTNGSVFMAPADFTLRAMASDPDGFITKVDFYRNGTKLGSLLASPYTLAVSNQPLGTTSYSAVAMDNQGLTSTTAVAVVTVQKAFSAAPLWVQILHASDLEAGVGAIENAPRFASVLASLKAQMPTNTVILSSGDDYIPGPFFNAAADPAAGFNGVAGRGDITLMNAMGFQAAAFGNHEFDNGTATIASLLKPDAAAGYPGTLFPYLSANLNFSPDGNLAGLVAADGQVWNRVANKIAKTAIIPVAGQNIGVVGVTTPDLRALSSPGSVGVDTNIVGTTQAAIDALLAQGVNKIIVLAHLQQYTNECALAQQLRDADVVIAGGSHALFAKATDRLLDGDARLADYPLSFNSLASEPVLVVNNGGTYQYVSRLVVQFDTNGVIANVDPASGAYAADEQGVRDLGGYLANTKVVNTVTNLGDIIYAKDGNITGRTLYFLNGLRTSVRTEESNLGDLTADANLWRARLTDPTTTLSLKNGGGIRDSIGAVLGYGGGADYVAPLANPAVGKQFGDISQLDIENALRFNNGLSIITLTAQQVRDTMEWAVAGVAPGALPGQFPQVSGTAFSFDPAKAPMTYARNASNLITGIATPGERLRSLVVTKADGSLDLVVENGQLVGDPRRTFRMVTLDYMAGGGDNYYPLTLGSDRIDLVPAGTVKTYGTDGGEQRALADYLAAIHTYTVPDASAEMDQRIQNLSRRNDTVTAPVFTRLLAGGTGTEVFFTTLPGKSYTLQTCDSIGSNWIETGLLAVGDGKIQRLVDTSAGYATRFYRLVRD